MKRQFNKKTVKVIAVFSLALLALVGLTMAYYNSQKDFQNEFHVNAPGVAMYEDFNPADHWVPDEEKGKQAWFTNTGELDMLLRFKVEAKWEIPPTWTDEYGIIHEIDGRKKGDLVGPDVLTLYWQDSQNDIGGGYHQEGDNRVATGEDSNGNSIYGPVELKDAVDKPGFDFMPIEEADGTIYYYYKKILRAKGSEGSSTQHVLESVKFTPQLSNDGHHNSDYSHTQIDLEITGETVLVDQRAVEEQWPGVTVEIGEDGTVTWVQKTESGLGTVGTAGERNDE